MGWTCKTLDDCGVLILQCWGQDVHCGGSGWDAQPCSLAFCSTWMQEGRWKDSVCGTGALLSHLHHAGKHPPGICHAVAISTQKEGNPWTCFWNISPFSAVSSVPSSRANSD